MTAARRLIPGLAALTAAMLVGLPGVGGEYLYDAILTPFLALSLAAVGLNLLAGYAGQVSLGSAAFMAVGAYAAYNFLLRAPWLPLPVAIVLAGIVTALIGLLFGLPSLRLRGFYLAVSTLAAQFFIQWALNKFSWFSNNDPSGIIEAPTLRLGGLAFETARGRYWFALLVTVPITVMAWRLATSRTGRNFIAIRDHEVAARVIGIPVLRTKLIAFAASSFIIGIAGMVWAFAFLRTVEPAGFNLDRSFELLFIITLGGLGSISGAFLGSALIVTLPLFLARLGHATLGGVFDSGVLEMTQRVFLGALIIGFLIAEPAGIAALLSRVGAQLSRRGVVRA